MTASDEEREAMTVQTDTGSVADPATDPGDETSVGAGGRRRGGGAASESSGAGDAPGSSRAEELEAEGDAAADYLEELLDIVDLDGDIDIYVENDRPAVSIVAEPEDRARLRVLVGADGDVLDALQDLTRLAVQAATGRRSRLLLDVGGWREARRKEAAATAERVITEVRNGRSPVELEPMPAYQRKVVHDLVAEAGLRSESAGEEPERHVVVYAS